MNNPVTALHEALSAAVYNDLPENVYTERDWVEWNKMSKEERQKAIEDGTVPVTKHSRRPYINEVDVTMFNQTWGSTALGYGGIGGSALTDAYTVVVEFLGIYCVYFGGGRLAYKIDTSLLSKEGYKNFAEDLGFRNMASQYDTSKRYPYK